MIGASTAAGLHAGLAMRRAVRGISAPVKRPPVVATTPGGEPIYVMPVQSTEPKARAMKRAFKGIR